MPHRKHGKPGRWVRALAYLSLAAAGAAVIVRPPTSYDALDLWLTYAWGAALLVPGIVACLGAALPRYRWEWIMLPPLVSGTGLYWLLSWEQVVSQGFGHMPRAHILCAVTLMLAARFWRLTLDDREARLQARAEEAVKSSE